MLWRSSTGERIWPLRMCHVKAFAMSRRQSTCHKANRAIIQVSFRYRIVRAFREFQCHLRPIPTRGRSSSWLPSAPRRLSVVSSWKHQCPSLKREWKAIIERLNGLRRKRTWTAFRRCRWPLNVHCWRHFWGQARRQRPQFLGGIEEVAECASKCSVFVLFLKCHAWKGSRERSNWNVNECQVDSPLCLKHCWQIIAKRLAGPSPIK